MKSHKIYVNHLPTTYDTTVVEQLFSAFGKITEISYPMDRKTNKPKGYAFVTFEEADSAQKALEKNNTEIEGETLVVEIAHEKPLKEKTINKKRNRSKDKSKNKTKEKTENE